MTLLHCWRNSPIRRQEEQGLVHYLSFPEFTRAPRGWRLTTSEWHSLLSELQSSDTLVDCLLFWWCELGSPLQFFGYLLSCKTKTFSPSTTFLFHYLIARRHFSLHFCLSPSKRYTFWRMLFQIVPTFKSFYCSSGPDLPEYPFKYFFRLRVRVILDLSRAIY